MPPATPSIPSTTPFPATHTDALAQLQHNATVIAHVQHADAEMIEVGANDIAYSSTCGTNNSCYDSKLPQVTKNITAIVSRIRAVTTGRPDSIALLEEQAVSRVPELVTIRYGRILLSPFTS